MPLAEHETVTVLPLRAFRIDVQIMEVKQNKDVHGTESAADMRAAGKGSDIDDILAQILGPRM